MPRNGGFPRTLPVEALAPFLAGVRRRLNPGGLFLAEVPEWGFVQHREVPKRAGHEPHTLFFSPEAFWTAIREAGFVASYFQSKDRVHVVENGSVIFDRRAARRSVDATHLLGVFRGV